MAFLSDFFSFEANQNRKVRVASADEVGEIIRYVVHAEVYTDNLGCQFVEMDAEDREHADNLSRAWCEHFGAISCAVRAINEDGSLSKPIRYFD